MPRAEHFRGGDIKRSVVLLGIRDPGQMLLQHKREVWYAGRVCSTGPEEKRLGSSKLGNPQLHQPVLPRIARRSGPE